MLAHFIGEHLAQDGNLEEISNSARLELLLDVAVMLGCIQPGYAEFFRDMVNEVPGDHNARQTPPFRPWKDSAAF